MHENPFIVHVSQLIWLRAKAYAKKMNLPDDTVLYQVGYLNVNMGVDFPDAWPFFQATNDMEARVYFEEHYPSTRHLIRIDLSKPNPHSAVKEIEYGNTKSNPAV